MTHLRTCEVRQLLHNKFVVVLGDSVQRAVYKDLVLLLQKDSLLSSRQLEAKGELSFEHDVLLQGGRCGGVHNDIYYREVRQFCSGHHLVRFYFLTRAYSAYLEEVLSELRRGQHAPDLVVLNSCLWDLARHGRHFPSRYREDLECLFRRMDRVLPEACLLVWNTALPVADVVAGGLLPPGGLAGPGRLRQDVIEANFYSAVEAARRGFDLLDLHFHFRHAAQHRLRDGVHWDERAHRRLSQLLLAHVADAWGVSLPGREPAAAAAAAEGRSGRDHAARRRRQPRGGGHEDGRGDPRDPAARQRPRSPQRAPGLGPQGPASFPPHQEGARRASEPPAQHGRGATARAGREPPLGPIRRLSTPDRRRAASPYPAQRAGGSQECRHHRRRTQHTRDQGPGSQASA